jgi:hypothetical protein
VATLLYIIVVTDKIPTSKNTLAIRNYYLNNKTLKRRNIERKKHYYLPNVHLKNHDIHYDLKKGFINFNKIELVNTIKIKNMRKPVIIA